jgi:hypothetical protein
MLKDYLLCRPPNTSQILSNASVSSAQYALISFLSAVIPGSIVYT